MLRGVSLIALFACGEVELASLPDRPEVSPAHTELRDQARSILEANCGSCHLPGYETSHPVALGVFDLSEPEWAGRMRKEQLWDAAFRLTQDLAPGGEDGVPLEVADEDIASFRRYMRSELRRRKVSATR
ncbi:MAG: cytochrome c [Myxococcota bacterium]